MADLYVSTDLNTFYNTNARLVYFRANAAKITNDTLTADIESLDRRIAAFEKVTLPSESTTAAADADFPYDREGLKREFMQEVAALLIRSSNPIIPAGGEFDLEKTTLTVGGVSLATGSVGGIQYGITHAGTDSAGGASNFDTLNLDQLIVKFGTSVNGTDTTEIFNAYSQLIDKVFAEGDKIATATGDPVEVVTAIPAVTIDGVLYDRMATVSTGTITLGGKTVPTAPLQYLLEATAATSSVTRGTELTASASAPGAPLFPVAGSNINARRLLLKPEEAMAISNTLYTLAPLDVNTLSPQPALTVTLTRDSAGRVQSFEDISLSLNGTPLILESTPVHIPLRRDPLNLATLDQITAATIQPPRFDSSFKVANDLNTAFNGTLLDAVGWNGTDATFGSYMLGKFGDGDVYYMSYGQLYSPTVPVSDRLLSALDVASRKLDDMPGRKNDSDALRAAQQYIYYQGGITFDVLLSIRRALVSGGTEISTTDSSKLQPKAEPVKDIFAGPRGALLLTVSNLKTAARSGMLPPYGAAVLNAYNAAQAVITNVNGTTITTYQDQIDKDALIAQANALIAALKVSTDLVGADVGDPDNIPTSRRFTANGTSYLVSLNAAQDRVFVTSLGPVRRALVAPVQSLTAPQYLYHLNEVRITILRGKMSYQEAVVREIQEDLRRANEALADLEKQSGVVTDATGFSAETLTLALFSAMASTPGKSMMLRDGDSMHGQSQWASNRTALKNYIDRRSSEAQQATLDYQNILNRYNNAYEVMSKMQEKIDNLLKGQLRNFS